MDVVVDEEEDVRTNFKKKNYARSSVSVNITYFLTLLM